MTDTTRNVPVISMAEIHAGKSRRRIDAACREWGFFQVVDHGIDMRLIASVRTQMRRFFALPRAEKLRLERSRFNPWGFYDQELTRNVRDWKQIFDYGPGFTDVHGQRAEPRWPSAMPAFRTAVETYYAACEALAQRILSVVALNLQADAARLLSEFGPGHTSFMRLNYYPVCPAPEAPAGTTEPVGGHLGLNRHTDAGALTLLLQDQQPGLEVFNRGRWHLVEPVEGAITVNVGDIVQVWSNDQYRAALHRVLANSQHERYSIPYFYNPRSQTRYAPLPSTINAACPPRYRSINWGEFRAARVAGDYADFGEEVQISHYAIAETDQERQVRYGFC